MTMLAADSAGELWLAAPPPPRLFNPQVKPAWTFPVLGRRSDGEAIPIVDARLAAVIW